MLEIGAGSGYAAAVLGQVASEVYTVERPRTRRAAPTASRASRATQRARPPRRRNARVGPSTRRTTRSSSPPAGPSVPEALSEQLEIGGRLVIPVGVESARAGAGARHARRRRRFETEDLGDVRFVPLIGAQGGKTAPPLAARTAAGPRAAGLVAARCRADPRGLRVVRDIDAFDLGRAARADRRRARRADRRGDARHVRVLPDARAHHAGADRAEETSASSRSKADWPDAARDRPLRPPHRSVRRPSGGRSRAFRPGCGATWRSPSFVDWLHARNATSARGARRLLRSRSVQHVHVGAGGAAYLDDVDPPAAQVARMRYGCLTPWQGDPAGYGQAALSGQFRKCEDGVVAMLVDILQKRGSTTPRNDGERYFDAAQNARLVASAERYYRSMYYGSRDVVESARQPHVRHAAEPAGVPRAPTRRRRVGAQLAHRQRRRHRDVGARRTQHRPVVPRDTSATDVYLDRLRHA